MDDTTKKAVLYVVSTPIGNLGDMTFRAVETLKNVDLIAAEDTRRTKILLDHFEIKTRLISYHSFNEHQKTAGLLDQVIAGTKLAVVSDAGTPCIADPGFLLVREAVKLGIEPIIIPGVSSLTFAAAAAGLPVERFAFYGFLPVKSGRRHDLLERIKAEDKTVVFFESPYRIEKLIAELAELMPDVKIALVREATKVHEEIIRGTAAEVKNRCGGRSWKGEFVVVVSKHSDGDLQEAESSVSLETD